VMATIGGIELSMADLGLGIEPGSGLLACQKSFLRSGDRSSALAQAAVAAAV
jgi:hypothetical protein